MAATQLFLVSDNSTYANFSSWASAVAGQLAACTWIQTTDTGQVMWSGLNITAVSMSGTTMTCTYSSQTGLALAIGRALTVTGWTGGNTGNNGVFVITGGTLAAGSGTFTATNASGVTVASGGTGVVTANTAVPGSGATVYEIWVPNDGLTNFFLRMDYGNFSGATNSPAVRVTVSTTTNGAGTATGFIVGPFSAMANIASAADSATLPIECNFSGAPGRFHAMMWRVQTSNWTNQMFSVERSVNSTGAYTGSHVTLITSGGATNGTTDCNVNQQSLLFGVGVAPAVSLAAGSHFGGFSSARTIYPGVSSSSAFNNSVAFDVVAPYVGYWDYGLTGVGVSTLLDLQEGLTFTMTLYGSTRTYIASKSGAFTLAGPLSQSIAIAMRFD